MGPINESGIHFTHYVRTDSYSSEEIIDIESSVELDSARVFFNDSDDIAGSELDFSPGIENLEDLSELSEDEDSKDVHPRISDAEFSRRKNALSSILDECMRPLLEKLEEQARLLEAKDLEIKQISMQVKLLPDLEKQLTNSDEELKLKHFENHTLKQQINLMESNGAKANNLTRLSNSIIQKVESKAQRMQYELMSASDELISANEEIERLEKANEALSRENKCLVEKNTPWWHKLFS